MRMSEFSNGSWMLNEMEKVDAYEILAQRIEEALQSQADMYERQLDRMQYMYERQLQALGDEMLEREEAAYTRGVGAGQEAQ